MRILVTGCAGFIGAETCCSLEKISSEIIGIDTLNKYYSVKLKKLRLQRVKNKLGKKFKFFQTDLKDKKKLKKIFLKYKFDIVINLAAQAGVRYSLKNPKSYIQNNINGFFNLLEICKEFKTKQIISASSSSVYGDEKTFPLKENFCKNRPIQLYAATKLSNEAMGYVYSSLYNLRVVFLRFFTVYGPWGRPDMFLFKLVKNIRENKYIDIYNNGKHERDFTYIEDISKGIVNCIVYNKNLFKNSRFQILNMGRGKPIKLLNFINIVESAMNKKAKKKYLPIQKGDVLKTFADIKLSKYKIKYNPKINYKIGIAKFIDWYLKNEKKI